MSARPITGGQTRAEGNGAAQLWIIDPHGNLVLRYGPGVVGKDVLNDLRLLLIQFGRQVIY